MTLTHNKLLIGQNTTLIPYCNEVSGIESFGIYATITGVNNNFNKKKISIESICNIQSINESSFSNYEKIKFNKYELYENEGIFGNGDYYHLIKTDKFSFISNEKAIVNHDTIFVINHPYKKKIKFFSEKFKNYNNCEIIDFKDFDLNVALGFSELEYFNVDFIGMLGHVHKDDDEKNILLLNKHDEIFFNTKSFDINALFLSDLIESFRKNEDELSKDNYSNFNYSNIIVRKKNDYFMYSEATAKGISYTKKIKNDDGTFNIHTLNHHDRFGFLLKLNPSKEGISNDKISIISYLESLNSLLKFKSKIDEFNSNEFISQFQKNLESVINR